MGIYDRDYYRSRPSRGGFGCFDAWSVTTWLIVINVAIFFLDGLLWRMASSPLDNYQPAGPLERFGYFSTAAGIYSGQIWRFITFQFLHTSPGHLIVNMLALYFFGPIVELQFGARRYLGFYLLCGLAGAVSFVLLAACNILGATPDERLVGASAGIFGLLVAAAMIAPDVQIYLFLTIPISIRLLAIGAMGLAAYAVFALGANGANAGGEAAHLGGEAAHLGGGVLGFVLVKNQHWLNMFAPSRFATPRRFAPPRRRRPLQKDWSKDFNR